MAIHKIPLAITLCASKIYWTKKLRNTTKEEEANIVKAMLHNQYSSEYAELTSNNEVLILIGALISSRIERNKFFEDPDAYVKNYMEANLSKKEIVYVCYYIECVIQNRIPNPMRYALDI